MKRKKWMAAVGSSILLLFITACGGTATVEQAQREYKAADEQGLPQPAEESEVLQAESAQDTQERGAEQSLEQEETMTKLQVTLGGTQYTAVLYDNETTRALLEMLPMTISMSELNGNEKYCYLSEKLPTNSGTPNGIHAGDLMLYGPDCLVLFYDSLATRYRYTPLGHVEKPDGISGVLGDGDVEVTFEKCEEEL